jgi:hypothetical protein
VGEPLSLLHLLYITCPQIKKSPANQIIIVSVATKILRGEIKTLHNTNNHEMGCADDRYCVENKTSFNAVVWVIYCV